MTIKEVEQQTGLARSHVRFYEKEKLIEPLRNAANGYRDYTKKDIEDIKKIAFLRTLGLSIEDIRKVKEGGGTLQEALKKQNEALQGQITQLSRAKMICTQLLRMEDINYEQLDTKQYVTQLEDYWKENRQAFRFDSAGFLYHWGSFSVWAVIAGMCFIAAALSYKGLPPQIPVQWRNGAAAACADKKWIFAYPAACAAVRYLLRPYVLAKWAGRPYAETIAEYLSNYACFVLLSVEIFSILFFYGAVKSIEMVLFLDTAVLLGLLAVSLRR